MVIELGVSAWGVWVMSRGSILEVFVVVEVVG